MDPPAFALSDEDREAAAQERVLRFTADLTRYEDLDMMRRWTLHGDAFVFDDDGYFALKSDFSERFAVHSTCIVMVGSGKLGFTIKPDERYRTFADGSDIDVAIVARDLYESLWKEVFDYVESRGQYRPGLAHYHLRGWLRPDKFPIADQLAGCNGFNEIVRAINESGVHGRYEVKAALYHDWHFLEQYQIRAIRRCRAATGDLA